MKKMVKLGAFGAVAALGVTGLTASAVNEAPAIALQDAAKASAPAAVSESKTVIKPAHDVLIPKHSGTGRKSEPLPANVAQLSAEEIDALLLKKRADVFEWGEEIKRRRESAVEFERVLAETKNNNERLLNIEAAAKRSDSVIARFGDILNESANDVAYLEALRAHPIYDQKADNDSGLEVAVSTLSVITTSSENNDAQAIVTRDGAPVSGAVVAITQGVGASRATTNARTDSEGRVLFEVLQSKEGVNRVQVAASGFGETKDVATTDVRVLKVGS